MAASYPSSSSRMDGWDQRRGLQTTWVGNKRRKLASKVDQNGAMSHSLPSHSLSAGLLSNHALPNPSLVPGPLLHSDVLTARSIPNRVHLFPHSSSNFKLQTPIFSTTTSSPSSSSSPLTARGNANNNNNDVILTGIYSVNPARQRPAAAPPQSESATSFNISRTVHNKNNSSVLPLQSKPAALVHNLNVLPPSSGPPLLNIGASLIPQSWTRQYGTANSLPWSNHSTSQAKTQPRPHSNPQPQSTANSITQQKVKVSIPVQNSNNPSATPRIQQVFTLSEKNEWNKLVSSQKTSQKTQESQRNATSYSDASPNFSIAMETGDEEDEWQREEELANMAAQSYVQREQQQQRRSPNAAGEVCSSRSSSSSTQPATTSKTTGVQSDGGGGLHGYEAVAAQTSFTTETSSQTSVSASAEPWVLNSSRKRTLQDRTQFSDGDLVQLKRYWDRGMTSLGSVCKDKINAAANELSVDTEIVKTWISNRRRKYRLMGIEIPPPKGGPAVFTASSPGNESPVALSPDVDRLQTPDLTDDTNDGLSEDGTINSHNREAEDDSDMSTAPLAINVKVEPSDDDEDEVNEDGVDMMASDLEQMQSLLEFKHEEVQFLENELENQKQRYQELAGFTKSLLIAVRKKDLERQQELIDSLPPSSDQDWDLMEEEDIETPASPSADDCTDHRGSPGSCGGLSPLASEDITKKVHKVTEPSASEGKD
ncbi:hypothetical protein WMY93_020373 [Mugilogobius chulae]|uniref:Homeobox domain-containing protein n=1 Tax=Mugilogobius chulae TaxID=88201 RepID=A0AAW0NGW7_9GOBI